MVILKNYWLFFVWLLIIFYLSFTPLTGWPQPTIFQKLYIDKVVHVFMYSVLSFLLLRGNFRQQKKQGTRYGYTLPSLIFCASVGIAIEFLQPLLTMYRKFEWLDMVANATGVLTGWLLFKWISGMEWFGFKLSSHLNNGVR